MTKIIKKKQKSNVEKFNPHKEYQDAKLELVQIYQQMGMEDDVIERIFKASERMTIAAVAKYAEERNTL